MDNKYIINKVLDKENLTKEEAYEVMDHIMKGDLAKEYVAGLLIALRCKGETIDEITSFASAMKDNAIKVKDASDSLDIVGTGGDNASTINISSTASFIIAASGIKVLKHGNRSVSSKCGAADLLEGLGININLNEEQVKKMLDEINISFLFAQVFHKSMKNVAGIRKELQTRTFFNILGPLTNPADTKYAVIGVYDKLLCNIFARVMNNLGYKKAYIVHSEDGLDEISISAKTYVTKLDNGKITEFTFNPVDYGFKLAKKEDIKGGDIIENVKITDDILSGKLKGPKRDCVILNAGFGISLMKDISFKEAFSLANNLIDDGSAYKKLDEFRRISNDFR